MTNKSRRAMVENFVDNCIENVWMEQEEER